MLVVNSRETDVAGKAAARRIRFSPLLVGRRSSVNSLYVVATFVFLVLFVSS